MEVYQVFLKTKLFVKASCVDPRKTLFVGQWKSHFLKEGSMFPRSLQPYRSPAEKFLYSLHILLNIKSAEQKEA